MKFGKIDETRFLLRLEKGEEIIATLQSFCQQKQIVNAEITGIGSIDNPILAHYRVDTKKYSEKKITGIFEVTSLLGTVAMHKDELLIHLHITIGDESMNTYAGHFVKGTVSATFEIVLTVFPSKFEKKFNEEIGLKLYEFPE